MKERRYRETKLIRISKRTYERLSALGRKGESFDAIISRILDRLEELGRKAREGG